MYLIVASHLIQEPSGSPLCLPCGMGVYIHSVIKHGNIEKLTETMNRIFIDVPAKERLWKALLLGFGNKIKVVGPEEYKKELIETA